MEWNSTSLFFSFSRGTPCFFFGVSLKKDFWWPFSGFEIDPSLPHIVVS